MRQPTQLVLAISTALALVACGGDNAKEENATSKQTTSTAKTEQTDNTKQKTSKSTMPTIDAGFSKVILEQPADNGNGSNDNNDSNQEMVDSGFSKVKLKNYPAVQTFTNKAVKNKTNSLYTGDVSGLAQGCYAIKSAKTGNYITGFKTADVINDGLSYKFSKDTPAKFFFKPTGLDGKFMLRDVDGRFFGTHLPLQISAGKTPGEFVEWQIEKQTNKQVNKQGDKFKLKAVKLNRYLKHRTFDNSLILYTTAPFAEREFQLVRQDGCTPFPEVTTNVEGSREQLKGDVNQPVRGFIDPHTHISSYQFMGGRMMAGKPFSPWGVEDALKDSKDLHGENGSLDMIGNLYTFGNLENRYDTRGWPDFPWWPNAKQMSHMGYYYKWIERAHMSGLKMMVTNLVENEVLCNLQKSINPSGWVSANACETMNSLYKQIDSLYALQDYIDAQEGGKGKGFFRIVTTPAEARRVIANGQLAVVIGIEASETFNCGIKDKNCTQENVENELNKLYDKGVRSIFPVHKFDNRFGGSPVESGFINVGQWVSTGKFFETEACDAETKGMKMESGFPLVGNLPFLKDVFKTIKLNPEYDETIGHCNKEGLTPLGAYLVNRMIDKKMMIEFDHMSNKTANAVLEIAEKRGNYSGLITSHSWMRQAKNGHLNHYNVERLLTMGGFAGAYNLETYKMGEAVNDYLTVLENNGNYVQGVGISTDMSGLGTQAQPRTDVAEKPLKYPFTTEFGTVVHKQQSGNRSFDINQDGMAHFGLIADHVQDIRERDDKRIYEALMNSTEAYLQMWERSENSAYSQHHNPL